METKKRGRPPKNKVEPKQAGRPSKYKPEYDEQAYKLCLLGTTDKQLADFFNTSEQTINAWKISQPSFLESLKRGKDDADAVIAQSLFHRAKGYSCPEIITATHQGQITDTMEVVKHYPPDTTAAIFWLKNRNPKSWRDKQEIEQVNLNADLELSEEEADAILKKHGIKL